jgi:hypothetical protein
MKTTVTVLSVTALCATLRYNMFKGVAWSEWPVYGLNTVFALSALLFLTRYAIQVPPARRRDSGAPVA